MVENGRAALLAGRHQSLGEVVYGEVLAMILGGQLPVNARLPSEAALARRFGVSRPVVRQALAKLRDERLIASRQGSGSFVQYARNDHEPAAAARDHQLRPNRLIRFEPLSSMSDLQRYFDFRIGVEGEAAAGAAINRTQEQLDALFGSLTSLEKLADTGDFGVEVDYGFHLEVAEASDNHFILAAVRALREQIIAGMMLARILSVRERGVRLGMAAASHRAIVGAIEARAPDEARQLMRRHLESAKQRMLIGPVPPMGQVAASS